jgi:POT family proton-dependent oligopeptide transporter
MTLCVILRFENFITPLYFMSETHNSHTQTVTASIERSDKMPSGIPYIVGNEAAERFSFYGMKAILTTFLVSQFFNPTANPALQQTAEAQANEQTHFFLSMAYLMPLLGGYLADRYWGKYQTILYVSLIYCLGHACLALFDDNLAGFTLGLLLIAMGAGGIKPCVSANVGDQFDESNKHLIPKAFSIFYWSINFGAFFSQMIIPAIYGGKVENASLAFGIPGILMGIATIIFFAGRNKYRHLPPSGANPENFLAISAYALRNQGTTYKGESFLDVAKNKFTESAVEGVKSVWKVLAVFAFIPIFWALYDQNGSEWVLQAQKLDLNIPFLNKTILPEQVQSINAIFILIFTPLFAFVVYPMLEKRGIEVSAVRKIAVGMLLTVASFLVIAWLQTQVDAGLKPNIAWQFLAYIILTAGEVLVSITGLEYAYSQAPPSMKSTLMSFWLLTVASGNFLVSKINNNIEHGGVLKTMLAGANYYWFYMGLLVINSLLFIIMLSQQRKSTEIRPLELVFASLFCFMLVIVVASLSVDLVKTFAGFLYA